METQVLRHRHVEAGGPGSGGSGPNLGHLMALRQAGDDIADAADRALDRIGPHDSEGFVRSSRQGGGE